MKESLCIVVKVANGKSIFHVSISREQVTFLGLQSSLLQARGDPALVCVFAKK